MYQFNAIHTKNELYKPFNTALWKTDECKLHLRPKYWSRKKKSKARNRERSSVYFEMRKKRNVQMHALKTNLEIVQKSWVRDDESYSSSKRPIDEPLNPFVYFLCWARRLSKFIVAVLLILIELVLIEANLLRLHTSYVLQWLCNRFGYWWRCW